MRVDEFDYELPQELIAQEPLADRAASRMLVVDRAAGAWTDRTFNDLPEYLGRGDCLIINQTRVFPSRLFATRDSGPARIEVFLLRALDESGAVWSALVRPGRKVAAGETLRFSDALAARVIGRGEHGERTLHFPAGVDVYEEAAKIGHVPLPPYIKREDTAVDRERYQTVFARELGSVAAPTAGLHFTREVLERCTAAGAMIAPVTLHVGLGTFAPVHVERVEDVKLHSERFHISACALDTIRAARRRIAVGTTSVRAVEAAFAQANRSGETDIFIAPGYRFRLVDALLTNFHLPRSTLLMLVSALAGRDLILGAYRHAVGKRYRFFSYGDCMLIL